MVCGKRCTITGVKYKNNIEVAPKDDYLIDSLCPIIASNDARKSTLVPESTLCDVFGPHNKTTMEKVE